MSKLHFTYCHFAYLPITVTAIKRIFKYFFLSLLGLLIAILLYLFTPGLWHRWFTYPKLERMVQELQAQRREVPEIYDLKVYRGVMHSHSYWSHDSEGTLTRIIPAAKKNGIDFIFLTDHPHHSLDSFPRGYHGYYDGILIEPGSERHGYCAWPMDSTVIDWSVPRDTVIRDIVSRGGMFFYAHSEEDHNWSNPYYQGMEIYNIHTDIKDESLVPHVANFFVNGNKFRHWALRGIFDEPTSILALWDSLNTVRKIVGFSAVDAHENQNFRARMLADGRVQWLRPDAKPFDTVEVTFWNRWMFHEPDEEGWVFEFMVDTYETSFNHVLNYVLADTLSVSSLRQHILVGHLFVAFKGLGDATGFMFYAVDNNDQVSAILGDSVSVNNVTSLRAVSPLPGKFRLVKNGKVIDESEPAVYGYDWDGPVEVGNYRVEVRVELDGEEVPWVYSNMIYVE